ncbi:MAG TPA: ATPase, T2SS/T4P/T4SS family, partial [Candidatus Angelobacter sp.]|nr:ATPase, T2SS/T4P/T4SS family [Candidatus Angelobacter sp.]
MNQKNIQSTVESSLTGNGSGVFSEQRARDLADRYRCEFIDLRDYRLDAELFKSVPVDLMFRYNFVPLEEREGVLWIAIADPSKLMLIDEISLLLSRRVKTKVALLNQINDILKKTEQSQRVLEEASEGFVLDVVREEESAGDENLSIDRITAESDISPIIRLVDTTIFTALQKRASDIHIESESDSVVVKYRIDGVLQQAMQPMAKEHHSTIITRVKVMSELDISERRVPQDGRFRVKYANRLIDFRVSIMPTIHG